MLVGRILQRQMQPAGSEKTPKNAKKTPNWWSWNHTSVYTHHYIVLPCLRWKYRSTRNGVIL